MIKEKRKQPLNIIFKNPLFCKESFCFLYANALLSFLCQKSTFILEKFQKELELKFEFKFFSKKLNTFLKILWGMRPDETLQKINLEKLIKAAFSWNVCYTKSEIAETTFASSRFLDKQKTTTLFLIVPKRNKPPVLW